MLISLSAICLGLQGTPRPPNVEFTSLIVFLVGATFGSSFAIFLGTFVMLINGFISPWGFGGLIVPFQVIGMSIIGLFGGLYGRLRKNLYDSKTCFETAVLGASLTLIYDTITNFGTAILFLGMPIHIGFPIAMISGAPFSALHVISNTAVFGLIFFPLAKVIQQILGGEKI